MPNRFLKENIPPSKENAWSGRWTSRAMHRIGIALCGIWCTNIALNIIWPLPDQINHSNTSDFQLLRSISGPKRPVSILILEINQKDLEKKDIDIGNENNKSLKKALIANFTPSKDLQILEFSTSEEIDFLGNNSQNSLKEAYIIGGVKLISEILSNSMKPTHDQANRYLIIPPHILFKVIDKLGGIELPRKPDLEATNNKDNSHNHSILKMYTSYEIKDLLLTTSGQGEIMANSNLKRLILKGLSKKLRSPKGIKIIKDLAKSLSEVGHTNLTSDEMIGLGITFIKSKSPSITQYSLTGLSK